MAPSSPRLDTLGLDVLLEICRFVEKVPQEDKNQPRIAEPHPLRPLSLVSKGLRDICTPLLFRRIVVKIPACKNRNTAWWKTYDALENMDESPLLGRHVRSLDLRIEGDDRDPKGWDITRRPSENIPPLLAKVLSGMTRLQELAIKLPNSQTGPFAKEFKQAKLTLPSVRKMYFGRMCGFMIDFCPNLIMIYSLYDSDWEIYRSCPIQVRGWFRELRRSKDTKS